MLHFLHIAYVLTANLNESNQHSYDPQHSSMSLKRENFVEIEEREDDRKRHGQKWSADYNFREESCNGSGTLIERMAKQTRPRMMTIDESTHIPVNSNNVDGAKFQQVIHQNGDFPYILYDLLMNAESMKYSEIISFTPDGRAFFVYDTARFEKMVMPYFFSHEPGLSFMR